MTEEELLSGLSEITDEDLAALYLTLASPAPVEDARPVSPWTPSLTPKQLDVFYDTTPNLLLVSQRFTGKSWAAGYAAVKHAYDYHGALVLIIAKTKRQLLAGGLMEKLGAEILPDFEKNIDGFSYAGPKTTQEKDLIYEIKNRYGTKSIIQMMSVGNDNDLQKKVKGLEASLLIIDEITLYETPDIFMFLSGTLGRRSQVPSEMQRLIATTNPNDPEHWVAKTWSVLNEAERDHAFRVIAFLPEDNPSPKVQAYYERLRQALRNNPTAYARDIEGKWVAVPQGDAIFKDHFILEHHVRGDLKTGELLMPRKDFSITIGLDIGDVNHGVTFLQEIPTRDRVVWIAFDEATVVGKKISIESLTLSMMTVMQRWCEELDHSFLFNAVSDKSAFDRFRAQTGSYDHLEVQKHYEANRKKFPRLEFPLRIIECPKPDGSVETRTRLLMDLLGSDSFFVSAKCERLIETLRKITPKKDNPFVPDPHSPYKHSLDSTTYPLLYFKSGAGMPVVSSDLAELKPQVYAIRS